MPELPNRSQTEQTQLFGRGTGEAMEEQYSCDEDDWDVGEEKKSLLSSRSTVSSRGGRLSLQAVQGGHKRWT